MVEIGSVLLVEAGRRLSLIVGCWKKAESYWWMLEKGCLIGAYWKKVVSLLDAGIRLSLIGGY